MLINSLTVFSKGKDFLYLPLILSVVLRTTSLNLLFATLGYAKAVLFTIFFSFIFMLITESYHVSGYQTPAMIRY